MGPHMKETLDIMGMTCASCSARVGKAASGVPGVTEANVNLLKNSMELDYDGNPATVAAVVAAIDKAGYGASPRSAGAGAVAPGVAGAASDAASGMSPTGQGGQGTTSRDAASSSPSAFVNPQANADKATRARRDQLLWSLVFGVPLFYLAMGPMLGWPEPPGLVGMEGMMASAVTQLLLATVVLFVNRSYFTRGFKTLAHLSPNMDSLIAIGSAASYAYSLVGVYQMALALGSMDMQGAHHAMMHGLYFDSAGTILVLITLGKYFEARAKGKTTSAISALMDLAPKTATVVRDGVEVQLPTERVRAGETLVVRTGEAVPVDGVVTKGEALVDESAITGEPVPVQKAVGDSVTGATVTKGGWFQMEATAVGQDTALAGIIRLVDEATSTKAPIERVADRIAGVFVPAVIAVAVVTLLGWLVVFAPGDFAVAFNHAVSVLVISCPCALGLATPTAIMVGTERGAANGIMIKSAEALETACKLDVVVLDKTGTMTEGAPRVSDAVLADGVSEDELIGLTAAVERMSEHPLAAAIVSYADERNIASEADVHNFVQVAGGGLEADVAGHHVLVGNARLMADHGVGVGASGLAVRANEMAASAETPLFAAADGDVLGLFGVTDVVKPSSADAVSRLRALGVRTVMLTGDQAATARVIAARVGVDEVVAGVLPGQKEQKIRELQRGGDRVAMVGDGINDAPALARADVGIAIGAGTDVAIGSADIVLMHSDPADVATAIELSLSTMRNIKQNLFWALFYNTVCIPVAMGVLSPFGITLNPMVGAAAMGFSSVFVVSNALRLFRWEPRGSAAVPASASTSPIPATDRSGGASSVEAAQAGYGGNGDKGNDGKEKETHMKARTLSIEGMMCEHCAAHVTEALEAVRGVENVVVDLDSGTARLDAGLLVKDAALERAVEGAGYKVKGIE